MWSFSLYIPFIAADADGFGEGEICIMTRTNQLTQRLYHTTGNNAYAVSVSMPATRFITFNLREPEMPVYDIIPFYIEKALDRVAWRIRDTSRLQNGTLLIKVDIETLLKTTLGSYPVMDAKHLLIPPEVSSLLST